MVSLFLLASNTPDKSFALQMLSGDKISIIDKHIEDDDVFVSANTFACKKSHDPNIKEAAKVSGNIILVRISVLKSVDIDNDSHYQLSIARLISIGKARLYFPSSGAVVSNLGNKAFGSDKVNSNRPKSSFFRLLTLTPNVSKNAQAVPGIKAFKR